MRLALGAGRAAAGAAAADRELLLAGLRRRCAACCSRAGPPRCWSRSCPPAAPRSCSTSAPDLRVLAFTAAVSLAHRRALAASMPALRAAPHRHRRGAQGPARGAAGRPVARAGPRRWSCAQVALCAAAAVRRRPVRRAACRTLDASDGGFEREQRAGDARRAERQRSARHRRAAARLDRTYRDLLQRVEAIPGVRAATPGALRAHERGRLRGTAAAALGRDDAWRG